MQEPLRSIQIRENRIEQRRPLDRRLLDPRPLGNREDERNRIHRPGIFAAVGKTEVIGDALRLYQLLPAFPPAAQLLKAQPADFRIKFAPVPAWYTRRSESFVPVTRHRGVFQLLRR